ncbi:MAG TPA: hypothetical protein VHL31_09125, partial [Geminicoccus sp.]|nr:hypothetical protein [Geminicoccus sp.]
MIRLSRRTTFSALAGACLVGASSLAARPGLAQEADGPFRLEPLPYAYDKNAPTIDAMTMELHHDKHHAAYVNNL